MSDMIIDRGGFGMCNAKVVVLATLHGLSKHYHKMYCYPTQDTLVKLIYQRYGISISRRTLCRWLSDIEGSGLVKRVRRIRRSRYGIEFRSTLYEIPLAGYRLLQTVGVAVGGYIGYLRGLALGGRKVGGDNVDESRRHGDVVHVSGVLYDILSSLRL